MSVMKCFHPRHPMVGGDESTVLRDVNSEQSVSAFEQRVQTSRVQMFEYNCINNRYRQ